eukprot:g1697.t1
MRIKMGKAMMMMMVVVLALHVDAGGAIIVDQPCCEIITHRQAAFGGKIPSEGLSADLSIDEDVDACTLPEKHEENKYNGTFLLVKRGNCSFAEKAFHAQRLGAAAIIVYNDEEGGDYLIVMQESSQEKSELDIDIPAVFIGNTGGQYLILAQNLMLQDTGGPAVITLDKSHWWASDILWFLCASFTVVWCFVGLCFVWAWCRKWWRGNERKRAVKRIKHRRFKAQPAKQHSSEDDAGAGEEENVEERARIDPDSEFQQDSCVICLCEFEDGDMLCVLPCKHEYHRECIEPWLLKKSNLCPICKTSFLGEQSSPETGA